MLKQCNREDCEEINPQPISNFYKRGKYRDGVSNRCISCEKRLQKIYRQDPKVRARMKERKQTKRYKEWAKKYEARDEVSRRRKNLRYIRHYGMTIEEYEKLEKEQNYTCKICKTKKEECGEKGLVVDHCHDTGKIRGLLCGSCNRALGYFKDNPEILYKGIEYLLEHVSIFEKIKLGKIGEI